MRSPQPVFPLLLALTLGPSSIALAGCVHVKPFERSKLAHPTMTSVGEPGVAEAHMHAVHEGAAGGTAAAESGCGCN